MPTLTVNTQCTRCPRVSQREISVEEVVKMASRGSTMPQGPQALAVQLGGGTLVEYAYLCSPCTQIVSRYAELIAKRPKHQSALRGEKIEIEED